MTPEPIEVTIKMPEPLPEIKVLEQAYQTVYGKPLSWYRILLYSQVENEQYLRDKVEEYIIKHTVVPKPPN